MLIVSLGFSTYNMFESCGTF